MNYYDVYRTGFLITFLSLNLTLYKNYILVSPVTVSIPYVNSTRNYYYIKISVFHRILVQQVHSEKNIGLFDSGSLQFTESTPRRLFSSYPNPDLGERAPSQTTRKTVGYDGRSQSHLYGVIECSEFPCPTFCRPINSLFRTQHLSFLD